MGQTATDQRPPRTGPGTASVVAAYRRALPRAFRRQLAALAAPHHADRLRAALKARREQAASEAPGRIVVTVDGRPRIAHLQRALSPVQARRVAVLAVTRALRTAGVPYFAVRGRACGPADVAVPAAARHRAGRALARLCRVQPAYVTVVAGASTRGPSDADARGHAGTGAGAGTSAGARGAGPRSGLAREGAAGPYPRLVPGYEPGVWQQLEKADVLRLTWFRTEPGRRLVIGADSGCEVEFWHADPAGDRLLAPRPGRVTDSVPAGATTVKMTDRGSWGCGRLTLRTREEFVHPLPEDVTYGIDAVYTWTDPELRYALRSLATYAPWIRRIHLLTDDGAPPWLDTAHPGLSVVGHREVFADPTVLPTSNPRAVESQLHHIDGLAEHFLYFNDDVFLGAPLLPDRFFLPSGITRYFPSRALLPSGPPAPGDVPVSIAGKNNRALLQERFGTYVTQKMKHTPHALRRSTLAEIEERFPDRHRQTAASRFRSATDLSIPSAFHHYYAAFTGRAVPGQIPYDYFDLAHPDLAARLARLLRRRDRNVFCLNDTLSGAGDLAGQVALVRPFLAAYFPHPSPFER